MHDDTSMFLSSVFDGGVGRIALWSLPDKSTKFFSSPDDAAVYAREARSDRDIYFAVGLQPEDQSGHRARSDQVVAITCLWADIDTVCAYREGKNYPPNDESALWLLSQLGFRESFLVHSGGGMQAFWLLREPWVLLEPKERAQASILTKRLTATLSAIARSKGWRIDGVGDLARVMRLPGTINHKSGLDRPVRIVHANPDLRYAPDDFDAYLVDESYAQQSESDKKIELDHFTISPVASAPHAIRLAMDDSRFKRTWERRRKDLVDPSFSGYDMAIANEGVARGWTDQQIVDAIICFRVIHHGDVERAMRRHYLSRTLFKARSSEYIRSSLAEISSEHHHGAASPEQRAQYLDQLSAIMGRKVLRWIRHEGENPVYTMVLGDPEESVRIGSASNVTNYGKFCSVMYSQGVLISFNRRKWKEVLALLLRVVEHVENPEGSSQARVSRWLNNYLSDVPVIRLADISRLNSDQKFPVACNGTLMVIADHFRRYINIRMDEKISPTMLYDDLRSFGFKPRMVRSKIPRPTSCYYWVAPIDDIGIHVEELPNYLESE